jgi:hypothetical protein
VNYGVYQFNETTKEPLKSQSGTSKEPVRDTNNNDNNINNENKIYSDFEKAFLDFEEMRKKTKAPLTENAKKLIIKELNKLSKDEQEQIAILNQSTMKSWKGVFPLSKIDNGKPTVVYEKDKAKQYTDVNKYYENLREKVVADLKNNVKEEKL